MRFDGYFDRYYIHATMSAGNVQASPWDLQCVNPAIAVSPGMHCANGAAVNMLHSAIHTDKTYMGITTAGMVYSNTMHDCSAVLLLYVETTGTYHIIAYFGTWVG